LPSWFREEECALCRDGGVGLSQAGCGFVFVLKLRENSVLMSSSSRRKKPYALFGRLIFVVILEIDVQED